MTTPMEMFEACYNVRNDGQAHTSAVNLDDMPTDDLKCASAHPALHELVRQYAQFVGQARTHRLNGDIALAMRVETKLDRMYDNLPQALRW